MQFNTKGLLSIPENQKNTVIQYTDNWVKQNTVFLNPRDLENLKPTLRNLADNLYDFATLYPKTKDECMSYQFYPIFDDLYPNRSLSIHDLKQSAMGECFFDGSIISIVQHCEYALRTAMCENPSNPNQFFVRFYHPENDIAKPYYYLLNKSKIDFQKKHPLKFFTKQKHYNYHTNWAALLEKAYTIHRMHIFSLKSQHYINPSCFINGGNPQHVLYSLLGECIDIVDLANSDDILEKQIFDTKLKKYPLITQQLEAFENRKHEPNSPYQQLTDEAKGVYSFIYAGIDSTNYQVILDSMRDPLLSNNDLQILQRNLPALYQNEHIFQAMRTASQDIRTSHYQPHKKQLHIGEFANHIKQVCIDNLNKSNIIVLATKSNFGAPNKSGHTENILDGMAGPHAYGVLNVIEDKEHIDYLRILNPWQHYSATYDDQDQMHTDTTKSKMRYEMDYKAGQNNFRITSSYTSGKYLFQDFSGVSDLRIDDVIRKGSNLIISNISNALVLLNLLNNTLHICLRFGFFTPYTRDIVNRSWKVLQAIKTPSNSIETILKDTLNTLKSLPLSRIQAMQDTTSFFLLTDNIILSLAQHILSTTNIQRLIQSIKDDLEKTIIQLPYLSAVEIFEHLAQKNEDNKLTPIINKYLYSIQKMQKNEIIANPLEFADIQYKNLHHQLQLLKEFHEIILPMKEKNKQLHKLYTFYAEAYASFGECITSLPIGSDTDIFAKLERN